MEIVALGLTILGAILIVIGVALLSVPAAFVVAGSGLVAFGLFGVKVGDS